MLNEALEYASRGWYVFPCRGKVPLTHNGFKEASIDPAKITAWWTQWPDANIAMATGKISGVIVVDVDIKKGAGGDESLFVLESKFGKLPDTPQSRTPSGGRHYFFKYPSGYEIPCKVGIEKGIDIRGDGGYVILPPSKIGINAYGWDE